MTVKLLLLAVALSDIIAVPINEINKVEIANFGIDFFIELKTPKDLVNVAEL